MIAASASAENAKNESLGEVEGLKINRQEFLNLAWLAFLLKKISANSLLK